MSAVPVPVPPSSAKQAAQTQAAAAAVAGGNVDKIREIIFGGQMKEYESRFQRLEDAVQRDLAEIRESTRKRLDTLEAAIRRELEALASRDNVERDERHEALGKLSQQLKEQGDALAKKLSDSDTRHSDAERGIRNDMASMNSSIGDDLERRTREVTELLERRFRELNSNKTDRAALASMLTEVAMRLQGDFHLPGE